MLRATNQQESHTAQRDCEKSEHAGGKGRDFSR
jgi:hypothetical protein